MEIKLTVWVNNYNKKEGTLEKNRKKENKNKLNLTFQIKGKWNCDPAFEICFNLSKRYKKSIL